MLFWIFILAGLSAGSATLGLGHPIPLASPMQGLCLTLAALFAMGLFAACDAFETQAASTAEEDE
jgi:hypothetical protein